MVKDFNQFGRPALCSLAAADGGLAGESGLEEALDVVEGCGDHRRVVLPGVLLDLDGGADRAVPAERDVGECRRHGGVGVAVDDQERR